jgi:hypothetical protein
VGTDYQPTVYDFTHASSHVIRMRKLHGGVLRLAFAPTGSVLAINTLRRTVLVGKRRKTIWHGFTDGIGWLHGRFTIAAGTPGLPSRIYAFDAHGDMLAVATADGRTARVLAGPVGHLRTVLALPDKSIGGLDLG